MDRSVFSESALFADASARAGGRTDFGPDGDDFRGALAALVASVLDEGKLRDGAAFRELLVHQLVNRLHIRSCLVAHPEIEAIAIPRPMFVSGLPRAGTTTFSRLLAEDERIRTPRLWELLSPAPTDLAHPWALTEDRIAKAEEAVLARARAGTLGIRPISIFLPDECFYLMRNSFDTDHFHRAVARAPSYFAWVGRRDRRGVYAYYRSQLQLLLWQRACPPGGHVVLKNPFVHLENMKTVLALFPGATIVNLARDVVSVMKSLCFKNRADRRVHSDDVPAEEVGRDMLDNVEAYYQRRAASLATLTAEERRQVFSIDFDAWAGDPVAIMRKVYARTGQSFPEALADRMRGALGRHQRYGEQSKYDLAEFGLVEGAVRARLEPFEVDFRRHTDVVA